MNPPPSPLRILVVENDVDTRTFFKMYLEQLGHRADGVSGVSEALSALGQSSYDLLFVDIGLADGSGWDLMNIVRERRMAHPRYAVAMTGYGQESDMRRSRDAGFAQHLVKPVDVSVLKQIVLDA